MAALAPFVIAIASAIGSSYLTTLVQARQAVWMEKLQKRVGR